MPSHPAIVTRRVFAALERWIGAAERLQGAMYEVARMPVDRLTAQTIVRTISDAAGQDLSWLFAARGSGRPVNYAVTGIVVDRCTRVRRAVCRHDGQWSGSAPGSSPADRPRATGEFDSGDAIASAGHVRRRRPRRRPAGMAATSRARSSFAVRPARPPRISIPIASSTLDRNRLDNASWPRRRPTCRSASGSARWMVWLQHTMLSYGFLA